MEGDKVAKTHLPFILLYINLVPQYNEREVLRVVWACLDEELVPPAVEGFERLSTVDVVHKYTAIRSTVKRHSQ